MARARRRRCECAQDARRPACVGHGDTALPLGPWVLMALSSCETAEVTAENLDSTGSAPQFCPLTGLGRLVSLWLPSWWRLALLRKPLCLPHIPPGQIWGPRGCAFMASRNGCCQEAQPGTAGQRRHPQFCHLPGKQSGGAGLSFALASRPLPWEGPQAGTLPSQILLWCPPLGSGSFPQPGRAGCTYGAGWGVLVSLGHWHVSWPGDRGPCLLSSGSSIPGGAGFPSPTPGCWMATAATGCT